jgi:hypothetical protein
MNPTDFLWTNYRFGAFGGTTMDAAAAIVRWRHAPRQLARGIGRLK